MEANNPRHRAVYVRADRDTDPKTVDQIVERFRSTVRGDTETMERCYIDRESNTIADLAPMSEFDQNAPLDTWLITRINVPIRNRGKGFGTAMLKRITDDADRLGVMLYLQPISSGHWNNRTLRAWYVRHGFRFGRNYYTRTPYVKAAEKER